jgi:hypothetical protein
MLYGLPWLGRLSCISHQRAPSDDRRFNWSAGLHIVPSAASPSAQKWNDIGADVILAKKFKRLVRRWITLVSEGGDSLLPCRHAVSISPIVKEFGARIRRAAVAAQHSYITSAAA